MMLTPRVCFKMLGQWKVVDENEITKLHFKALLLHFTWWNLRLSEENQQYFRILSISFLFSGSLSHLH